MEDQPVLLLTVDQTAWQLSIGRSTVYKLIQEGGLPSMRLPTGDGKGRLMVPREALLRWIDENTIPSREGRHDSL